MFLFVEILELIAIFPDVFWSCAPKFYIMPQNVILSEWMINLSCTYSNAKFLKTDIFASFSSQGPLSQSVHCVQWAVHGTVKIMKKKLHKFQLSGWHDWSKKDKPRFPATVSQRHQTVERREHWVRSIPQFYSYAHSRISVWYIIYSIISQTFWFGLSVILVCVVCFGWPI